MLYVKDHMEDCDWKNNEFATNVAHTAPDTLLSKSDPDLKSESVKCSVKIQKKDNSNL